MTRILFLCDGNACRSKLAEAALRRLHPDWDVCSAGWDIVPEILTKTRLAALEAGLVLDGAPKHWSVYAGQQFDAVVAFSQAAADAVPWDVELMPIADPTPEGSRADFIACRDAICKYVEGRWGE